MCLSLSTIFQLEQSHRVTLLKILHTVIEAGAREKIDAELAHEVITFCTAEMIASAVLKVVVRIYYNMLYLCLHDLVCFKVI
jgi:hypothetical protein